MHGMEGQLDTLLQQISIFALPAIFAITFHEAAHGFVAHRLGDDTAFRMGRVTFNPLRHIDLYGTILMPIFLLLISQGRFVFGFAKPVPVNFGQLRHPRRDMIWVALAGPGINILLALVSALLFYVVPY
ncbi:MAG TPA: site-2 protease family protein, partial [Stellaceae bacterium]|nr:site-2 protease family protein [Stellaceae bacterium]